VLPLITVSIVPTGVVEVAAPVVVVDDAVDVPHDANNIAAINKIAKPDQINLFFTLSLRFIYYEFVTILPGLL
jgi:hypothetical protein